MTRWRLRRALYWNKSGRARDRLEAIYGEIGGRFYLSHDQFRFSTWCSLVTSSIVGHELLSSQSDAAVSTHLCHVIKRLMLAITQSLVLGERKVMPVSSRDEARQCLSRRVDEMCLYRVLLLISNRALPHRFFASSCT